jgi:hypothetical protein
MMSVSDVACSCVDVPRNSRGGYGCCPSRRAHLGAYLTGMLLFQMSRYIFQPPSAFL